MGVVDQTGIGIAIDIPTLTDWGVHEAPDSPLIQRFLDGDHVQTDGAFLSLYVVAFHHGAQGINADEHETLFHRVDPASPDC